MRLSIIIPCYNVENYIDECLNSLLFQLNDEVEVILVDDCSTDSTYPRLLNFQSKFKKSNIRVFKNVVNSGVSASRNMGLHYSTGDYIAFIDSDDVVDKFYITSILKELKGGFDYYEMSWENFGAMKNVRYAGRLPKGNWAVWCRVFKKSIIKHEFDVKMRTAEDHKFIDQNLNDKLTKGLINRPIYFYRRGRIGGLTTPIRDK